MPLIIEDGTGVPNANSYVSVAEVRAYASARGLGLPSADADVEILIVKANDYLETLAYKGDRSTSTQPLEWPRYGVVLFTGASEYEVPDDAIPTQLKKAQCQLAYDASLTELLPTGDGREVVREKVDVLEVQYAEKGSSVSMPTFTKANKILTPLLAKTGSSLTVNTVRV